MIRGIDISSFQGKPDFSQVKTSVDFIIIKASEGIGYTDPTFHNNQSQIRSIGIPLGYYHFARPDLGNTPEAEAEWFLSVCIIQDGEVLALDFEVNYTDRVNWCKRFLDHINSKLGYKSLIYLNLSLVKRNDWSPIINAGYGLWLADYDGISDNTPDTPWPIVAMKQWSSTGQINGISGDIDLDTLFGDINTLKAYSYHPVIAQPIPQVNPCQDKDDRIQQLDTQVTGLTNQLGQITAERDQLKSQNNDLINKLTLATQINNIANVPIPANQSSNSFLKWLEHLFG